MTDLDGVIHMSAIRPPVKWYGGKHYVARRIVANFPPHRIYVEPFGGGASVLLTKKPAGVEVYNDVDLRISRLFRVLRDRGDEFLAKARLTLYSEHQFDEAAQYPPGADDVDMALCDFVRWRQSFGGQGGSFGFSTTRSRGGKADNVNGWWSAIAGLPEVIDRIRRVQIMCRSAFEMIPKFDHPAAVMYCDPPYVHSTRNAGSRKVYNAEMTDHDHRELARLLGRCKSKVLLSGYRSAMYDELYKGWRLESFDIANHAAGGREKARMVECLWMNF
jgi:DNA adenine methylase